VETFERHALTLLWTNRVPISTSFGRRPVYLLSQLINFGTSIWRAKATSYNSFMGACVVNGLGAGPAETIMPTVIADIFFLHDRGKWNTLYWVVYMGSLMVGPIVSGSMAEEVGWRSFWWLNTALLGTSFLMVVGLFPETRYERSEVAVRSPNISKTEIERPMTVGDTDKIVADEEEKIQQIPTANSVLPNAEGLTHEDTAARDPYLGKGTPAKWQWAVFQPNAHPFRSILFDLWIPWKLFAFPIVEFASFVVSWSASSFLTINLTQSQAFAAPPYNMKPMAIGESLPLYICQSVSHAHIGFQNFAILVGALIGLFTAGPLSDYVSARSTRRNKGIREPEMRLPAMIPYIIIMYVTQF
jgi:MFS family permease